MIMVIRYHGVSGKVSISVTEFINVLISILYYSVSDISALVSGPITTMAETVSLESND